MDRVKHFTDDRNKAWCIHCGEFLSNLETNQDHVPTKGLLFDPLPPDLPVVKICMECNSSFSADEEYMIAFLGAVISGSTEPEVQKNKKAARILQNNPQLKNRIDKSKIGTRIGGQAMPLNWKPEIDRINNVVTKNARGHVYFEYGEPVLDEPESVKITPLETLSVEDRSVLEFVPNDTLWPEVGSRMMMRKISNHDLINGWINVQTGVYRYTIIEQDGIIVRSILYDYLATEVFWSR